MRDGQAMTKRVVIVGNDERHEVEINYSMWSSMANVKVDGNLIFSKFIVLGGDTNFEVGEKEKHKIKVVFSGAFVPNIDIWVDNKPV